MNNDNKYLEELKNAYNPFKNTLLRSYKLVNRIARIMHEAGYNDEQIKTIANQARLFWHMKAV